MERSNYLALREIPLLRLRSVQDFDLAQYSSGLREFVNKSQYFPHYSSFTVFPLCIA